MDIDYLIDDIFKKQEPLLRGMVASSSINLLIGATVYTSGNGVFFNNHDGLDIFEILRASKALPVVYNKNVRICGEDLIDGDMSISMEAKILKAGEFKFDRLIVISNEHGSLLGRVFLFIYSCFVNKNLRANIRANSKVAHISESEKFIIITPSKRLPTGALGNNRFKIKSAIDLGHNDAINNVHLRDLAKSNK